MIQNKMKANINNKSASGTVIEKMQTDLRI